MSTLETIVVVGAAISTIIYLGTLVAKVFRTWFVFLSDWNGTDDRPGVVERLELGHQRFEKIDEELNIIKAELFANSGSSLRDSVDRIEKILIKNTKTSTTKKKIN